MHDDAAEFCTRVEAVLERFMGQNGVASPPSPLIRAFALGLYHRMTEPGRPAQPGPGAISEMECAGLLTPLLTAVGNESLLAEAGRQLVKACFYPALSTCRNSFCEVSPGGVCRRQSLVRALGRVSGAHCVDCPHWIALAAQPHADFLAAQWRGEVADFRAHRDVFLPEDFRALRTWLQVYLGRPREGKYPLRP